MFPLFRWLLLWFCPKNPPECREKWEELLRKPPNTSNDAIWGAEYHQNITWKQILHQWILLVMGPPTLEIFQDFKPYSRNISMEEDDKKYL